MEVEIKWEGTRVCPGLLKTPRPKHKWMNVFHGS